MKQRKSLELYPLTMCYFIKRTQKYTKLFFNRYINYKNMITSLMALTHGEISLKEFYKHAPIIIPFAPVHFGKTCLLYRLIYYFQNKGYSVKCEEYMRSIYSPCSPCSTAIPIQGKILWQGHIMAQFVDFPGEFLYNTNHPKTPSALNEIIESPNKKIWLFMLELNGLGGQIERDNYSERIMEVAAHISPNDKIIIVVNKIDMCSMDLKSKDSIVQALYLQYPAVLNCFKNQNPVTKLWRPFNCDIVSFSAGDFCRTCDNKEMFRPGLDTYPKQLWKAIFRGFH